LDQKRTFHAKVLENAIEQTSPERIPIIENLLYEKSSILLYADDGVGKSVLCLQAAMQMTVGDSKLFNEYHIPEPRNVIYFQMERYVDESFERIKHMRTMIPYDSNRLIITTAIQGCDLQDKQSKQDTVRETVEILNHYKEHAGFKPDVIIFDPIYSMVADDLSTAPACNAITGFFRKIQTITESSIIATSHTNRGVRDKDSGYKRVGKDMYGNRFLSAFFTGSYQVTGKDEDGSGTCWKLNKNSQRNMDKKFSLNYDPATYCSWIDSNGNMTKREKLDSYLMSCKKLNKEFSFEEMKSNSELSDSALRGHLSGYLKGKLDIVSKSSRGKILYRYLD